MLHFGRRRLHLGRRRLQTAAFLSLDLANLQFEPLPLSRRDLIIRHALLGEARLQGLARRLIDARAYLRVGSVGFLQRVPDRCFQSAQDQFLPCVASGEAFRFTFR